MIKALIVEDDPIHSNTLNGLLKQSAIPVEVLSVCTNVADAIRAIDTSLPELIFLDIILDGGEDGFEVLKQYNKRGFAVIFTTQHINTSNTIRAIRTAALDFLPKPLDPAELDNALAQYAANKNAAAEQVKLLKENLENKRVEKIWVAGLHGKTKIDVADIIYCASANSYTDFYLNKSIAAVHKSTVSIKDWEHFLGNSDICRIHNRFLVNLVYVSKYTPKWGGATITLKNGKELPVSKARKASLKERLKLYRK